MALHTLFSCQTEVLYEEIKQKVLVAYPAIKPKSIVPSEHIAGKKGVCKQCHDWPLFEKIAHGLYRVLPGARADALSIHEKLERALAAVENTVLTVAQIRQCVADAFPDTHLPSVIPLDHTVGGACRHCQTSPLLEHTSRRGFYRVLAQVAASETEALLTGEQLAEMRKLLQVFFPERLHLQAEPFGRALAEGNALSAHQRNALVAAVRERVVVDFWEFAHLVDVEVLRSRWVHRLYEYQGLRLEVAEWAVAAWVNILEEMAGARYPTSTLQRSYALSEQQNSIPAPKVAGITFQFLEVHVLKRYVYALKKQRHHIAWVTDGPNEYWLGVWEQVLTADLQAQLLALGERGVGPETLLSANALQQHLCYRFTELRKFQEALLLLDQGLGA